MAVTLAKKPAPKKKPVVKKKPAPPRPPTLEEKAAAIAKMAIDPAITEINSAVAAAEAQRAARLRATEGVTKALGAMTAGDAEAARAAWAGAAERVGQYGQGFTGALRGAQEGKAAEASALISRLGLPGAVETGAPANANVAHMLGAVIPGEGLAAGAARSVSQAQAHRTAAGLKLADNALLEDFKAGETVAGIRAKIQEIEAKRPGLILEAYETLRTRANAERATNVQIGYLQLQQAKTKQDEAEAKTNLTGQLHVVVGSGPKARVVNTGKLAAGSDAIVSQTRAETSRINAQTAAATARASTRQREASQARAEQGRNDRAAAARAAAKEVAKIKAAGGQATVSQKNTVINGATAQGTNVLNTIADRIWSNIPGSEAKAKGEDQAAYEKRIANATAAYKKRLRQNRGTMMAQVINRIGPNLRLIGYTPQQVKDVAARLVATIVPAS
jgi:hypothetical protein